MKKLFLLVFWVSIFSPLSVFASGDHGSGDQGGGHGRDSSSTKPPGHHDSPSKKMHQHGDKQGPVGSPAQPSFATRIIQVTLTDQMEINFKEKIEEIKSGTVIQFIVTNEGKISHEFSVGNQNEQKKHGEMMRKMPGMVHADGNTVTVQPGKSKALTWHFEGEDLVVFACNIPGHYEGGMYKNIPLRR